MIGAIAGDIIGSVFENDPIKSTAFPLFSKYSHYNSWGNGSAMRVSPVELHRRFMVKCHQVLLRR
jgi:ADP-ribosylglycohydrolase